MKEYGRKETVLLEDRQQEKRVVVPVAGAGGRESPIPVQEGVMMMMTVGVSHDGGGRMMMIVHELEVTVDFIRVGAKTTRMTTSLNGLFNLMNNS